MPSNRIGKRSQSEIANAHYRTMLDDAEARAVEKLSTAGGRLLAALTVIDPGAAIRHSPVPDALDVALGEGRR